MQPGRWVNADRLTVIGLDPGSNTHRDLDVVKQAAGGTTKGGCVAADCARRQR